MYTEYQKRRIENGRVNYFKLNYRGNNRNLYWSVYHNQAEEQIMRYERQCQECGLIFEVNYFIRPKMFICDRCRTLEKEKQNSKAMIKLERMKEKLGEA